MWSQSDNKLPMYGRIRKLRYYFLFVGKGKYLMVHYLGRFQRGLNIFVENVSPTLKSPKKMNN